MKPRRRGGAYAAFQATSGSQSRLGRSAKKQPALTSAQATRMLDDIRASVDAKTKRHRTPRRTLEQAFRELDVDRNAVLSPDEFCQGVTPVNR